jgi:DNA (cytosine-5)-methyltransferase 1
MFFELARILRAKQPRLCLFENVKGLLSHDGGKSFATIIQTLDELGYDCQWQVLNSKNHGVPQNRERVFIVGHLRGTSRPEVFPFGHSNSVGNETNKNANTLTSNYWKGAAASRPIPTDGTKIRKLTPTECERLQGFPDGWTEGVSDTQRYKTLGNAVTVNVIKNICEKL